MRLSRKSILVDAGPLVALGDPGDNAHHAALAWARITPLPLVSTWAVITEAAHFLHRAKGPLFRQIQSGSLLIEELTAADMSRLLSIFEKYPQADFADASLVLIAERLGITNIATLDARDFSIYRTASGTSFKNVFQAT